MPKPPPKTKAAQNPHGAGLPPAGKGGKDQALVGNGEGKGAKQESLVPFHEIQHLKKRAFLTAFCHTGNISRAAEAAKIDRTSHFHWLRGDAQYAAAFDQAQRVAASLLEEEARRRAVEGTRKLKFHEGQMIQIEVDDPENPGKKKMVPYVEHEYSDTLLIFLLKGNAPEKFKDRSEVKHAGKVEHEVTTCIIPAPTIKKLGDLPQTRG